MGDDKNSKNPSGVNKNQNEASPERGQQPRPGNSKPVGTKDKKP